MCHGGFSQGACQLLKAFCPGGLVEKKRRFIRYLKVLCFSMMGFFRETGAEVGHASGLRKPVLSGF
jgi:hypothetical protein